MLTLVLALTLGGTFAIHDGSIHHYEWVQDAEDENWLGLFVNGNQMGAYSKRTEKFYMISSDTNDWIVVPVHKDTPLPLTNYKSSLWIGEAKSEWHSWAEKNHNGWKYQYTVKNTGTVPILVSWEAFDKLGGPWLYELAPGEQVTMTQKPINKQPATKHSKITMWYRMNVDESGITRFLTINRQETTAKTVLLYASTTATAYMPKD